MGLSTPCEVPRDTLPAAACATNVPNSGRSGPAAATAAATATPLLHSPYPYLLQVDKGSEAPVGRGGAACVAIGGRSILLFGGASRDPAAFDDWWLMELSDGRGGGTWTRISPVVKLSHK